MAPKLVLVKWQTLKDGKPGREYFMAGYPWKLAPRSDGKLRIKGLDGRTYSGDEISHREAIAIANRNPGDDFTKTVLRYYELYENV